MLSARAAVANVCVRKGRPRVPAGFPDFEEAKLKFSVVVVSLLACELIMVPNIRVWGLLASSGNETQGEQGQLRILVVVDRSCQSPDGGWQLGLGRRIADQSETARITPARVLVIVLAPARPRPLVLVRRRIRLPIRLLARSRTKLPMRHLNSLLNV